MPCPTEPLNSDQVAQICHLPGMSGDRRGRTQTQAHLGSQLPSTELSNKTVCRPDPASTGPVGEPALTPASLGPNPTPAGPPPHRPGGWGANPTMPAAPSAGGLRLGGPQAACPLQVPRRPRKRAATARHMERRSRGGEGKGKSIRS